jgi:hypothetical protein
MKRYLISLIVSGAVCVTFASALVVAQAPVKSRASGPGQKSAEIKPETKVEKNADLKVEAVVIKNAQVQQNAAARAGVVRAGNVEAFAQQNIRQGRPAMRAEVIFVRKLFGLNTEQLRRINQDAETALKEGATKFAEILQRPRVRVLGQGRNAAVTYSTDGDKVLQQAFAVVMQKNLTPEQFSRYEIEIEKRNANRRQSALHYLVDAIDRDLYLSDQQRAKLTESLASHWDDSWCASLEHVLYGNQFYPMGIDAYVTPYLDDTQKRVWQGTQKVGTQWGFGGVMGNFMNDNDGLEEELGVEKKIDPIQEVEVAVPAFPGQLPAVGVLQGRIMIETKKAVVKEVTKNK